MSPMRGARRVLGGIFEFSTSCGHAYPGGMDCFLDGDVFPGIKHIMPLDAGRVLCLGLRLNPST